ncbi:MAG: NUDIX hydrolase [Candidatus Moraniibacteriota bacterium]
MEEIHLTAKIGQYGLIRNGKNEILVLQKSSNGNYCLPGGRINEGEDWFDALRRELAEELKIDVTEAKPFDVGIIVQSHQIRYCIFFIIKTDPNLGIELTQEHSEYQWVGAEELKSIQFEQDLFATVCKKLLGSS